MNVTLKILLMISWTFYFAIGLLGPIYAIFVEEIGGGLFVAGSSYAIFSIAMGVVTYIVAKWEDGVLRQENVIVAARGLTVLVFIGYFFIQTPLHLYIVQFFLGIVSALATPVFDSLYSKYLDTGKYASEWGLWEAGYAIVLGVSALLGGLITELYGFRVLFVVMLSMGILSFIASILLLKKIS